MIRERLTKGKFLLVLLAVSFLSLAASFFLIAFVSKLLTGKTYGLIHIAAVSTPVSLIGPVVFMIFRRHLRQHRTRAGQPQVAHEQRSGNHDQHV